MKKEWIPLKNKVFFCEITHSYFVEEGIFSDYTEALNHELINADDEDEKDKIINSYKNKRKHKVKSVTTHLSSLFPFKYEPTLIKGWLKKTIAFDKVSIPSGDLEEKLQQVIDVLDDASKLAQAEGSEFHNFLNLYLFSDSEEEKNDLLGKVTENPFINIMKEDFRLHGEISQLIESIDTLYTSEVPSVYYGDSEKPQFAGQWDLLYKNKDGEVVLLDIKTGSKVYGDKKTKVKHQLDAYNLSIQENLGINYVPTKHLCLSLFTSPTIDENGEVVIEEGKQIIELNVNSDNFNNLLKASEIIKKYKSLRN